jgi:hypothetical protein
MRLPDVLRQCRTYAPPIQMSLRKLPRATGKARDGQSSRRAQPPGGALAHSISLLATSLCSRNSCPAIRRISERMSGVLVRATRRHSRYRPSTCPRARRPRAERDQQHKTPTTHLWPPSRHSSPISPRPSCAPPSPHGAHGTCFWSPECARMPGWQSVRRAGSDRCWGESYSFLQRDFPRHRNHGWVSSPACFRLALRR